MLYRSVLCILACCVVSAGAPRAGAEERGGTLAGVDGAKHFPGDEAAKTLLAKQGFVVLPRYHKQIFSPYIGGELPYYVTADSAHRTYHVIFEEVLKAFEAAQAATWGARMQRLLACVGAIDVADTPQADAAKGHALAVVAVAARLLAEEAPVPESIAARVAAEVALIRAAGATTTSPVRGVPEDYAQYTPRGLYEGDPQLERWFRAAQWLGRAAFRVIDERETRAACLIAQAVRDDAVLRKAFRQADDSYRWLLGPPDDLTVEEYIPVLRGIDALREVGQAQMRLKSLRDPQINDQLLPPGEWVRFRARTKGLRLFPKRRTPDGWLAQELVTAVPGRSLVGGLEVAASLGSSRAARHVSRDPAMPALGRELGRHEQGFLERIESTHYGATLKAQALLFDEATALYGKARPVQGTEGTPRMDAPVFRAGGWGDRLLTTALAGWASLKHAWVLHTKSSVYYLGMTDSHPGVVEPAADYYRALGELARTLEARMRAGGVFAGGDPRAKAKRLVALLRKLSQGTYPSEAEMGWLSGLGERLDRVFEEAQGKDARDDARIVADRLAAWLEGKAKLTEASRELLESSDAEHLGPHLESFASVMDQLAAIVRRQLEGRDLTEEQAELIQDYGPRIAGLQFFGGNSWLSPRWQMGLVVDVGTDPSRGLRRHVAVGAPMELYVVLPLHGGGRQLYKGGVYSYYEFDQEGVLTDSAWRQRITARDVPPLPAWMSSYVPKPGVAGLVEQIRRGGSPEAVVDLNDARIGEALLERLREAPLETKQDDLHLEWVAKAIARYAREAHYEPVRDALLERLLGVQGAQQPDPTEHRVRDDDELGEFAETGPRVLGRLLKPEDHARVATLLARPPPGSHPNARARLAEALIATRDDSLPRTAARLLQDPEPAVRRWAVEIVAREYEYDDEGGPAEVAALLARHAAREQDVAVQALVLQRLAEVARNEKAREAAQPAARVAARLLTAKDARARRAAEVLGVLHARRHVGDLLHAISNAHAADASVMCPLLEGLGGALTGVDRALPDLSDRMLAMARLRLDAALYSESWPIAVSAMTGLARIGSAAAAASIGRFALDAKRDAGLRNVAINKLGEAGKAAIPYLFRLTFDETETGHSINDHQLRLCDKAATRLHRVTGGKFGWAWSPPDSAEARAKGLAALRAEAKRRGYR